MQIISAALVSFFLVLPSLSLAQIESDAKPADGSLPAQQAPAPVVVPSFHEIEITVRVKGKGRPIKRAEIKVDRKLFYTNPKGVILLKIPMSGNGKILVSRFGYEKEFIEFKDLRAFKTADVYLYPGTPGDNEVFIRGEKRPDTSKKSFSGRELARVTPSGDPAQVTKTLPGVQTNSFGNEIAVRGSGPDDSKYYINNFEVYEIFHRIGDLSILPDQLISDVDFYAGGFGAQYGNATGGIIVLRTKTEIPEEPKTEFRINLPFYSAIYHERPIGDDAFVATSFRYSYLQYILPYFLPEDSGATAVPYFGDVHALYHKQDGQGGHTKYLALGAQDGLELAFNYEEADNEDGKGEIDIYHGYATVGLERLINLGNGWTWTTTPQLIYDNNNFNFFDNHLKWKIYTGKIHTELAKKISKKEYLYVGFEPAYGKFYPDIKVPDVSNDDGRDTDFEEAPTITLNKPYTFYSYAAWVSLDKRLGNFTITPGLRYYKDKVVKGEGSLDPRLQARYELGKSDVLKASYGLYSMAPLPQESNDVFGNAELKYERSIHYVTGWESRWSDKWETDIQLYHKRIFHKIVPDDDVNYSNAGSAKSTGLELFVRRNLTDRAFGWLSYTYSETRERASDQDDWNDSEFDQTNVATIAGSYRLTATWDVGSKLKYNTGNTYTPVNDAVYNSSLDKYQARKEDEDTNTKRLPAYHQVDIFLTKDFLLDTWKMAARFGVQYLSFTKQVYSRNYNYDYTEEQDFDSLPPIPFIEIRGEY